MRTTTFYIREMTPQDFGSISSLWSQTEGVGLNESDTRENILRFLARNPGLSAVALSGEDLVGAVLCGHDGRRGYLHHLAVAPEVRHRGVARALLDHAFSGLARHNIPKCNIFVYEHNREGQLFWKHNGWFARDDLAILQHYISEEARGGVHADA